MNLPIRSYLPSPRSLVIPALLLIVCLLLSACGVLPGGQASSNSESGTPVPTPTKDPSGYQAIASEACLAADWTTMQSNKAQGDLMAWQPGTMNIAYLAPTTRSSWYIGELMLAIGPDYSERILLAETVQAAGDLTWSPSGDRLAFIAFRPNENVFTVMTVRADGSGLVDLFPTDLARTDARTSQKSVMGWVSETTVRVMSSCGEECRQAYDIQVNASADAALTPTQVADYRELANSLQTNRRVQEFVPEEFPRGLRDPHWSPDDRLVSYLDKRGFPWVLTLEGKTMYPLEIGMRDVYEMQWSSDSSGLALRAEDRIFVFNVPCKLGN